MRSRWSMILASALVLSACGDGSTLEIRLRDAIDQPTGLAGLRLGVDGSNVHLDEFGGDGVPTRRIGVPEDGRLPVVVLLLQGGSVVAEGAFSWELQPDFEWTLDIWRATSDPIDQCLGCSGSFEVPIATGAQGRPGESLWFTWGGRPKGSDIVF